MLKITDWSMTYGSSMMFLLAGALLLGGTAIASAQSTQAGRDSQVSIFGIGSCASCGKNHPQWMPQMVEIGVRDCRAMCGSWLIEQVEGKFDFTQFDQRLEYDESLGVHDGVCFNGIPSWLRNNHKGLPVNCLTQWIEMVQKMVEHTKGRITLFEVWNEPPNGTTKDQTAADYAKVLCATYDAAKSINPDAQIGMSAKSAHINYLDSALVAGARGHFDYITLHPYEILGCVVDHPGTEQVFLSIVPNVRKMLAKRDQAKINAPVFFTEIGYDSRKSPDKQAQALLKTYIMGIHQGVACINFFEGMDGDSGPMGLMDAKGNKRPAYFALGRLIESLGRHPSSLGWVMLNDKHYGFLIQGQKGPVLATWTTTKNPDDVDFGQPVQILDPTSGNTIKAAKYNLTLSPVLITELPGQLVTLAKSNKNKPMPWGGDYSNAKSVSVSLADKYEEKGLHTMAADAIAADVEAYAGNAQLRSGEVPKGGNVFYIDPNFLSYDTVPIEITAMVKRNDNNAPVNISIEYEYVGLVREGYKSTTKKEIPEGNDWHKLTWRIDDSQFTGTWAYHFRIDADVKKYRLQNITVTRLDK